MKNNIAKALIEKITKENPELSIGEILKLPEIDNFKKSELGTQKQYMLDAIDYFVSLSHSDDNYRYDDSYVKRATAWELAKVFARKNMAYTETEWMALFSKINDADIKLKDSYIDMLDFPLNHSVQQIERYLKNNPLSEDLDNFIKEVLDWQMFDTEEYEYIGSSKKRLHAKLTNILKSKNSFLEFRLKTEDIGDDINQLVYTIEKNKNTFHNILHLAQAASGAKPTAKFSKSLKSHLAQLDKNHYRKAAHALLQIAIDQPIKEAQREHHYDNKVLHYTTTEYLCDDSKKFIKGVVWTLDGFSDKTTISLLENLLYKSYTKIPEIGAAAAAVGNACIYVLGNMRGKDGLGALSRARLKLKQNNVKKLIQKQLDAGAEKYGVSVAELEEMAVPDFGLVS